MYREKSKALHEKYRDKIPPEPTVKLKPLPKHGTLERIHLVHPFQPSSNQPQDLLRPPSPIIKKKVNIRENLPFTKDLIDAETGEPISLTLSTWNAEEGRVNIDHDSILKIGTGSLKISERLKEKSQPLIPQTFRHPIITQMLKTGPIDPKFHRYWDPLSNSILPPSEAAAFEMEDEEEEYLKQNLTNTEFDSDPSLHHLSITLPNSPKSSLTSPHLNDFSSFHQSDTSSSIFSSSSSSDSSFSMSFSHSTYDPSDDSFWLQLEASYYRDLLSLALSLPSHSTATLPSTHSLFTPHDPLPLPHLSLSSTPVVASVSPSSTPHPSSLPLKEDKRLPPDPYLHPHLYHQPNHNHHKTHQKYRKKQTPLSSSDQSQSPSPSFSLSASRSLSPSVLSPSVLSPSRSPFSTMGNFNSSPPLSPSSSSSSSSLHTPIHPTHTLDAPLLIPFDHFSPYSLHPHNPYRSIILEERKREKKHQERNDDLEERRREKIQREKERLERQDKREQRKKQQLLLDQLNSASSSSSSSSCSPSSHHRTRSLSPTPSLPSPPSPSSLSSLSPTQTHPSSLPPLQIRSSPSLSLHISPYSSSRSFQSTSLSSSSSSSSPSHSSRSYSYSTNPHLSHHSHPHHSHHHHNISNFSQEDYPNYHLSEKCRRIAHLKVRCMREVVQAIKDEETKQAKREQLEHEINKSSSFIKTNNNHKNNNQNNHKNNKQFLHDLMKVHERERETARTYIRTLQRDNEIILLSRMKEEGFLW